MQLTVRCKHAVYHCARDVKGAADDEVDRLASCRSDSRASSAFTISPEEGNTWRKHLEKEKEKEKEKKKHETEMMNDAVLRSLTSSV